MRWCAWIMVALAPVAAAMAAVPIVTDSRIKTFIFNANEVYSVTTHYGYQANVEFGQNEEIETVSVGDRVGWQIVPAGRRLFIRAMEESAHTNMTIVTNLRAYQFDLRSSTSDAVYGSEELTYVMRFYYPEEGGAPPTIVNAPAPAINPAYATQQAAPYVPIQSASLQQPAPAYQQPSYAPPPPPSYSPAPTYQPQQSYAPPAPSYSPAPTYQQPSYAPPPSYTPYAAASTTAPIPPAVSVAPLSPLQPIATPGNTPTSAPTKMNYRYTYSGPSDIAPVKIYDDGRATYFKFRDTSQLPKFSVITTKGEQLPVPHQLNAEGLVVINLLAPRFSLEKGSAKVVVYNEAQG